MPPQEKRTFESGIVVGVLCSLLVGLPGLARAADSPPSTMTPPPSQIEDTAPPAGSILDKKPADAAVAQKQAQTTDVPFYENWKVWALAGGVVVGAIVAIIAAQSVAHQVNGGDVRPCNMTLFNICAGEGR